MILKRIIFLIIISAVADSKECDSKASDRKELRFSLDFTLIFSNNTVCLSYYCDKTSGIIIVSNDFESLPEWGLLTKCNLTNLACRWNSSYSEEKNSLEVIYKLQSKTIMSCNKTLSRVVVGNYKLDHFSHNQWSPVPNNTTHLVFLNAPDINNSRICPNETVRLSCKLVYFTLTKTTEWRLVFQNGTESDLPYKNRTLNKSYLSIDNNDHEEIGIVEDQIQTTIPADAKEIICRSSEWNTDNECVESRLSVYNRKATGTPSGTSEQTFIRQNLQNNLSCWVHRDPTPEVDVKWDINVQNQTSYSNSDKTHDCFPDCADTINQQPIRRKNYEIVVIIVSSALGILLFAAVLIITYSIIQWKKSRVLKWDDIYSFFNGKIQTELSGESNNFSCWPFDTEHEVNPQDFSIDSESRLSSGLNRLVLMAKVREMQVVAKTVKPDTRRRILLDLLEEIKIMSCLNEHPNILTFIGTHTTQLAKGQLYLFVEFCQMGSLEKYLRGYKSSLIGSGSSTSTEDESRLLKNLLNWSVQTASGMKYLAEWKIIHGDLSAKNILLKDLSTIKLTDFGLSRKFLNYSTYKKTQEFNMETYGGCHVQIEVAHITFNSLYAELSDVLTQHLLPRRHMSPEALSEMLFSTNSDVWAFGVTLWEIFSLCEIPYSTYSFQKGTLGFASALEGGLRLRKPSLCPVEVFILVERCWKLNPRHRLDFEELFASLQDIQLTV